MFTLASACTSKPDVVLLTVDTLRRDHVSAYNADSPVETPHIDSLAADGLVFTDAWSPISVTGPAFCTLMTGKEPGTHEVTVNIFRGGTSLADEHVTLAERLQAEGYQTGAFVSGFTLRPELGLTQGFETYDPPMEGVSRRKGGVTAERALAWMFKRSGPLMLWYHTYDAHGPWNRWVDVSAAGDWERGGRSLKRIPRYQQIQQISDARFYEARYASSVAHTDEVIGRLLEGLKQDGRYDRALIVLTADHGESFEERELYFDHGTSPHAEQLAVPLIVKLPGGDRAGERIDTLVGLRDVAPTVLELLGLSALDDIDGGSLFGPGATQLMGESSHCKLNKALSCRPRGVRGKLVSLRDATHTLVRSPRKDGATWRLYDRRADPGETSPLLQPAPADARAAVQAVFDAREQVTIDLPELGADGGEGVEEDEETRALRELGYLD